MINVIFLSMFFKSHDDTFEKLSIKMSVCQSLTVSMSCLYFNTNQNFIKKNQYKLSIGAKHMTNKEKSDSQTNILTIRKQINRQRDGMFIDYILILSSKKSGSGSDLPKNRIRPQ